MGNVTELRVALTVEDFDRAVAFYRDALGLEQIADWSSATGKVVVLEAGRATLELFDHAQAESVDAIEAGRRVSGPVLDRVFRPGHTERHGHRLHRQVPSTRTDGVAVAACCHGATPGKPAKPLIRNLRG